MQQNRTLLELLRLMLQHKKEISRMAGLCSATMYLFHQGIITFKEQHIILQEFINQIDIRRNRRNKYAYYWKAYKWTPRIKCIQAKIKELEQEEIKWKKQK